MTIHLVVSLASVLFVQSAATSTVAHQSLFSGTWRLDPTRSASADDSPPGDPVLVDITQAEREVTITTTQGTRRTRTVHTLTTSPSPTLGVDGSAGRAYWNGAALVTEGTRLIQGQTVAIRETRSLNPEGTEMTVDVIVMVQHGYEFRGARNYGAGRDVYVRMPR